MISYTVSGSTQRTKNFLQKVQRGDMYSGLESIAQRGVVALQAATPKDSSLTANSWSYDIIKTPYGLKITWLNSNVQGAVNVAVILQYGHGTGTGGYVTGQDYINGSLQPIFDQIAEEVWRKVTSA